MLPRAGRPPGATTCGKLGLGGVESRSRSSASDVALALDPLDLDRDDVAPLDQLGPQARARSPGRITGSRERPDRCRATARTGPSGQAGRGRETGTAACGGADRAHPGAAPGARPGRGARRGRSSAGCRPAVRVRGRPLRQAPRAGPGPGLSAASTSRSPPAARRRSTTARPPPGSGQGARRRAGRARRTSRRRGVASFAPRRSGSTAALPSGRG